MLLQENREHGKERAGIPRFPERPGNLAEEFIRIGQVLFSFYGDFLLYTGAYGLSNSAIFLDFCRHLCYFINLFLGVKK
jgi:hypothetical protein